MARLYEEMLAAADSLGKAVFSQPVDKRGTKKISVRPIYLKGELLYQAESIVDNKSFHRNMNRDELLRFTEQELEGHYRQALIVSERGGAQYCLKTNGEYKKTGSAPAVPRPTAENSHNREKEYILSEGENIPALVDLGIFSPDFHIIKSKYSKYRQINRFVELVDQAFAETDSNSISILDFGCGKSYLTFILYYYFAVKRGMKTRIIGYDLKEDVVERCNRIAADYGYVGLSFKVADVTKDALADIPIDMVVTLHACDTATDYALAYAVKRGVKKIFSVPCCQHEVNASIHQGGELDLLLEHGIIKERFCALLTDSVRASVLEAAGYNVDLIEFIDFEHSPKNIMLRAAFTGKKKTGGRERAEQLREKYGFKHSLLELI